MGTKGGDIMDFSLRVVETKEKKIVFSLLASAAKTLAKKKVNQWQYWLNPPIEKIKWVEEGVESKEFFFLENFNRQIMGVVRVAHNDLIYWGKMNDKAKYIHSLIIHEEFSGNGLGFKVVNKIKEEAILNNVEYLRLDCDCTNKKLCKYYINQGFKQVGQKQLALGKYNLYQQKISS
ncbi:MAG: GNAT family N-acetyltransferase [Flavobacteriales bacterium]|nr:GNAT family N-acetyltransferase [Flavobacteriales bacterium]